MGYSTPTRYIEAYGLDEAAQMLADEQRLLTSALLSVAVGGGGYPSGTSAEAQAAAVAALARLQRKLDNASSLMDGYLRSVVTLPLTGADANAGVLDECCLALTRQAVADDSDNATDRIDETAERWMTWLRDISRGAVQLVLPSQPNASSGSSRVLSGVGSSGINWGAHGRIC